ncbi:hypothetical protein ANO11243_097590 [Dothideomycetidae sp. 11243]|nr:hypothetical protein ANO11243_097590 [fungal sp. No.11243]
MRTIALLARNGTLRPFRLIRQDLANLLRRYPGDWTVFNQLILASAVYVFFTNLLPGITFASDLSVLTDRNWGTIEVIFSTGLCGVIFSVFSIQPLTILGVTGPFSVLAENIYSLCNDSFKVPFLPFMAWTLIHAGWMHVLLAIFNAHDWTMRYVTTFSTEIFSLLNSIIYFHKAIQELQRVHVSLDFAAFLYSIIGAVGTLLVALFLSMADSWQPLFHRYVRLGLTEYAASISVIFFVGISYAGELATLDKGTLPVSHSFRPTLPSRPSFLVEFWTLPVPWVFGALIPGLIITILFFFDHEVSSIICTSTRYRTSKPKGFALDVALLGVTTAICGILGLPPANGLLPQAPLHSESLLHDVHEPCMVIRADGTESPSIRTVRKVEEQRWSHFLHAAAILIFVAPPLQHVLGLIPTSVLAGLFLFMGEQSLALNPILRRTADLLTPSQERPSLPKGVSSYTPIHMYTLVQILLTVAVFIVTLTSGGPAFPLIIIALVPLRLTLVNRLWDREVLRFVDGWACRGGTPEGDEDRTAIGAESTADGHGRTVNGMTAVSIEDGIILEWPRSGAGRSNSRTRVS